MNPRERIACDRLRRLAYKIEDAAARHRPDKALSLIEEARKLAEQILERQRMRGDSD
jgi:hypothetical protein